MAHLFPGVLFVYKAREVFISNLSLIKLKISEMGFTAASKRAHKLYSLRGRAVYVNRELLDLRLLVKMEIVQVQK